MEKEKILIKVRRILLALLAVCQSVLPGCGQQGMLTAWFVDGYHGGIYGHYPKEWYTGFICDQLEQNPDWRVCLEIEPETWDTIAVIAPDDLARLRRLVGEGRVEFTNPTLSQPYLWNISGESIIRQFSEGWAIVKSHFPEATFTTYAAEEPCLTSCLPAVLTAMGAKYAVLRCPDTCWGGYPASHGGELVNMVGPDGTVIIAVPRPDCEGLEEGSVWQTASWQNSIRYLAACRHAGIDHPVGMCYQDAGWKNGPWLGNGVIRRSRDGVWQNVYTTWTNYIENVSTGNTDDDWHFTQEDIRPCLMWGSSVLNDIARKVRWAENGLLQQEKLAAMGDERFAPDPPNPNRFREAWRNLALAQHHDAWIVPYNGLLKKGMTWADWVDVWTRRAYDVPLPTIPAYDETDKPMAMATPSGCVRIYNTTGHARSEVVEVEGQAFPVRVPAFGYADFTADDRRRAAADCEPCRVVQHDEHSLTVAGGCLTITFDLDRGGVVTSLQAGSSRTEYVSAPAESPAESMLGELRGFFYREGRWLSSADEPVRCSVSGDGTPLLTVTLSGQIGRSPFVVRYRISSGSPLIDCSLRIDWEGNPGIGEYRQSARDWRQPRRAFCDDRYKLNILFPVRLHEPRLWKDAPFDVCESRQDSTWYGSWTDIRHNVVLHWVDISEGSDGKGLALLTDHTGSYSFGPGFPLALTAQYSGAGLWGRMYSIEGPLEMRYALLPHEGTWDEAGVARCSAAWNEPLIVVPHEGAVSAARSLVDVGDTGYELTSVRRNDKGIELRLFNVEGDADAHEIKVGGMPLSVTLPRMGIKTILVQSSAFE